ncbi:hypothetical protein TUBRATIS_21190 [Tubulinosema ratisbonensis]|uniref:Uncharacterized protein n=1 Tax=Tubulinosema ratisbonensis TaxID=291195 RepID=A0A437AJY7_9MICR|nr:hypothetical protein TUBRATIS_21190 [Tubulinosema ratisbonensis]
MYFLKELLLIAVFSKFVSCATDDKYAKVSDGLADVKTKVETVATRLFNSGVDDSKKAEAEKEITAVHDAVAKLVKSSEEHLKSSDTAIKEDANKLKLNVEFVQKVFGGSAGGHSWFSIKSWIVYVCIFAGGAIIGAVIYSVFSKKD